MNEKLVFSTILESGFGSHVSVHPNQLLAALAAAEAAFEVAYEALDGEGCPFPEVVIECTLDQAAEISRLLLEHFDDDPHPLSVTMRVVS